VGAVVTPQRNTGGDSASRHSRLLTHLKPPTSTTANKYLPRTPPASPRNSKWRPSSLAARQLVRAASSKQARCPMAQLTDPQTTHTEEIIDPQTIELRRWVARSDTFERYLQCLGTPPQAILAQAR
ncbi:unnamed protein product, partial [Ectocarpus sp. 13 AM-2016]